MNINLKELKKFYTEQLDILVNKYQFDIFLKSGSVDSYTKWENEHFREMLDNDGFHFCSGETKMVFWLEGQCDYVIKIPFLTTYEDKPMFDYCKEEARNYKMAEKNHMADRFAWCAPLTTYLGYPIYIMEYCECDDYDMQDLIYDYGQEQRRIMIENGADEDELSEEYYEDTSSEDAVWDYLYHLWDNADEVQEFCFDNHISDIHSANVGWLNGNLVIIDYSGFGSIARMELPDDWFACLEEYYE